MNVSRRLQALALALPLLLGCGDSFDSSIPDTGAAVRAFNGSPDVSSMDFFNEQTKFVQLVPYPGSSSYVQFTPGNRKLSAREAGLAGDLFTLNVTLADKTSYTIAAVGLEGAREGLLLKDDDTPAAAGSFKLRVVRLAPVGPAMDVYVTAPGADLTTATPTFTGVAYKDVKGYVTLPTGPGQIRVTEAGDPVAVVVSSQSLTFTDNQIATFYIVGQPDAGGSPYSALFLPDGALH